MTTPAREEMPTPRTDAEQWEHQHANLDREMIVSADFARTLERELSAAMERIAIAEKDVERLNALFENCWDLRCQSTRTAGGDDYSVHWEVHEHQSDGSTKILGYANELREREAIDKAIRGEEETIGDFTDPEEFIKALKETP